jgi:hypothetical protein
MIEYKLAVRAFQKECSAMSHSKSKNLGFVRDFESEKRDDDLQLLTIIEKQVQGVLGEVQYIAETIETHKKVAPVEDVEAKIKKSYEKIKKLMNPENADPNMALEGDANRRTSGGIDVEQNPLIKEMGGMPLEDISPEWREQVEGKILDKAELENLVNNKLKNRVELANKLKAKNKLKSQPKMRAGQQMMPQFKKIQETIKYILKNAPEPQPAPAPKPTTVPRPPGYG